MRLGECSVGRADGGHPLRAVSTLAGARKTWLSAREVTSVTTLRSGERGWARHSMIGCVPPSSRSTCLACGNAAFDRVDDVGRPHVW